MSRNTYTDRGIWSYPVQLRTRNDKALQPGRNSIHARVLATQGDSLVSLFSSLSILTDQIFYRSYVHRQHFHTCQPSEFKTLETSRNLCIVRMSLNTMSRNNLRKSPKRHSERPGDLMKNLVPGKPGRRVGRYAFRLQYFATLCLNCLILRQRPSKSYKL